MNGQHQQREYSPFIVTDHFCVSIKIVAIPDSEYTESGTSTDASSDSQTPFTGKESDANCRTNSLYMAKHSKPPSTTATVPVTNLEASLMR
jgi:hypothetical protein